MHVSYYMQDGLKNFAKNLKQERRKKGYTQKELAKKTGITAEMVSLCERGHFFPSDYYMDKILEALEVDLTYMLEDRNDIDIPKQRCSTKKSINGARRGLTKKEKEAFAKNLRQERLNNGYTQVELAEKTGVNSGMLSLYERGRFSPSTERLNTLSDALGVTAEYMLEEHACPDVITREQKTNFIKNLKRERLKKGYTLAKLSEKTGVYITILSQYETGRFLPGVEKMKKLSDALEVDMGYMLENKDGDDVPSQVCLKKISINGERRRLTKNEKETFARNLVQERLKKGYTQRDLSEKTGIRIQIISYYEVGRFFPCDEKLHKLLDALEVDLDYMLEDRYDTDIQKKWCSARISIDGERRGLTKKEKEAFVKNLKQERIKKGYTQKELAEKTGIGRASIYYYEIGHFFPSDYYMERMLEALEVDMDYMVEDRPLTETMSEEWKKIFGRNLKEERIKKGYTQKKMAEKAGISIKTLHDYEKGHFPERIASLYKLLNILGVGLDYMLEDRPCEIYKSRPTKIKSCGLDIGAEETRVFALNLRKEREKRGYTQAELSKLVGINCQAISTYETQRRFPSDQTMSKLLEVLDVDLEYMLNKKPL